jgi:outer membrane immunogenic protein
MSRQDQNINPHTQASAKALREMTMKKNILIGAVTALVLGPTAVLAADLPMKAGPVPAPIYDWTGFYIGVSGGGSIGSSDHVDRATGVSDTSGYNIKGGMAGGTLGYNWQIGSFVVGFEGDASWVSEVGSNPDLGPVGLAFAAASGAPPFPGFPLSAPQPQFSSFTKETWLATARARFGYAVNNLLFFTTAGYAGAGVDAGVYNNAHQLLASSSSTRSGWTAGGGIEWGFAPNWSTKFELLYMKFNTVAFNTNVAEGPRTVPLDDTVARIGINYRFGGPVVARY